MLLLVKFLKQIRDKLKQKFYQWVVGLKYFLKMSCYAWKKWVNKKLLKGEEEWGGWNCIVEKPVWNISSFLISTQDSTSKLWKFWRYQNNAFLLKSFELQTNKMLLLFNNFIRNFLFIFCCVFGSTLAIDFNEVVFVILSQSDSHHAKISDETKTILTESLIRELNVTNPKVFDLHNNLTVTGVQFILFCPLWTVLQTKQNGLSFWPRTAEFGWMFCPTFCPDSLPITECFSATSWPTWTSPIQISLPGSSCLRNLWNSSTRQW